MFDVIASHGVTSRGAMAGFRASQVHDCNAMSF